MMAKSSVARHGEAKTTVPFHIISSPIKKSFVVYNSALLIVTVALGLSCNNQNTQPNLESENESPTNTVLLSSEINWEKLNPARGDKSPQAGTLWGDRKGEVATGFLAKFVDGFSSPPHIHNVTYRAVVIKGKVHNDDANADTMWMSPGSFWTQPMGAAHITSAKGDEVVAYVEIDKGPYLVQPIEEAYDNGERPVNIDVSNLVWLDNKKANWIDLDSEAEICYLWKDEKVGGLKGLFVKLPGNSNSKIESDGTVFHSVVIEGNMEYAMPKSEELKLLDPGSYFGSSGGSVHHLRNTTSEEGIIYIRTNGIISVKPEQL